MRRNFAKFSSETKFRNLFAEFRRSSLSFLLQSTVSVHINACQTKYIVHHLIIYCFHCIWRGKSSTFETGLTLMYPCGKNGAGRNELITVIFISLTIKKKIIQHYHFKKKTLARWNNFPIFCLIAKVWLLRMFFDKTTKRHKQEGAETIIFGVSIR